MSPPSEILSTQERLLIAAKAIVSASKPAQPAWITASMRVAALLFVALILAAMAGGVFYVWRAAWAVGG